MDIKIRLSVEGEPVKEAVVQIEDYKLEELTEEERESAIEIVVRNWADRHIQIEWEAPNA